MQYYTCTYIGRADFTLPKLCQYSHPSSVRCVYPPASHQSVSVPSAPCLLPWPPSSQRSSQLYTADGGGVAVSDPTYMEVGEKDGNSIQIQQNEAYATHFIRKHVYFYRIAYAT